MDYSLKVWIILVILSFTDTVYSICSESEANGCTDRMSAELQKQQYVVGTDSYCGLAPNAYKLSLDCVSLQTQDCDSSVKASAREPLDRLKTDLNNACRGNSGQPEDCPDFTSEAVLLKQCESFQGGLSNLLSSLVNMFNNPQQPENFIQAYCNQLQNITDCMRERLEKTPCQRTRNVVQAIYGEHTQLQMMQVVCKQDLVIPSNQILPLVPSCPLEADRAALEASCTLDTSVEEIRATGVCFKMQKQVDCLTSSLSTCPDWQALYLLPRLDTYAYFNKLYGCNISIAGVEIKHAKRYGDECDLSSSTRDCFKSMVQRMGHSWSDSGKYNNATRALIFLYNWDPSFCQTNKLESFGVVSRCTSKAYVGCYYPQRPLYLRDSGMPINDRYTPAMGPFPLNVWGVTWLQEQTFEQCFTECENQESEYEACARNGSHTFTSLSQEVISEYNEEKCQMLKQMANCISLVTQKCPTLIERAEEEFSDNPDFEKSKDDCGVSFRLYPRESTVTHPTTTTVSTTPRPTLNITFTSNVYRGTTKPTTTLRDGTTPAPKTTTSGSEPNSPQSTVKTNSGVQTCLPPAMALLLVLLSVLNPHL